MPPRALCLLLLTLLVQPVIPLHAVEATPTVMVTGANRGIGLELTRQYAARGWQVIATAREPATATELKALAADNPAVTVEALDITDHAAVDALAGRYQERAIDVLINNAGKTPRYASAFKPAAGIDYQAARDSYEVNVLGTLKVSAAFLPHVAKAGNGRIVVISSKAGSFVEGPKAAMMYEYRTSKTALNMAVYTMAFETQRKGVTIVALSPGSVDTQPAPGEFGYGKNMRQPGAISVEESVTGLVKVIDGLQATHNGRFLDYKDGREIPW